MRLNPNSVEARLGYARSAQALGSWKDAKESYREVLKRSPNRVEAVVGLAEVFHESKEMDKILPLLAPALEEYPNHTGLKVMEAKTFAAMGKVDTAIAKLRKISSKLGRPPEVERMLTELYLRHEMWKEAEESLETVLSKESGDPESFFLRADWFLRSHYFQTQELRSSLPMAEENLTNALNLDPSHEASRFLLAKLKFLQGKEEEAFTLLYGLVKEFPDKQIYHYWEAMLGRLVQKTKFASYHYKRSVDLQDLDEITRYEAEDYAIENEKEEAKLRSYLGEYRKERYFSEKRGLYFKSSGFQLLRARDLIPFDPPLNKELEEYYQQRGDLVSLANQLIKKREEDPQDFLLQNRLEGILGSLKKSLDYREGFLELSPEAIVAKDASYEPEVFVFDFEPMQALPERPFTGKILGNAIRYHLKYLHQVRIPSSKEFLAIQDSLQETNFHPYSRSNGYSLESLPHLDKLRKNLPRIRFVMYGKYEWRENRLRLEWSLYDRDLAKVVLQGKSASEGRDQMTSQITRLTDRLSQFLPKEGKVLALKQENVVVTLGKRHGLKPQMVLLGMRGDRVYGEMEVVETGRNISLMKPKFRNWEREISKGDWVKLPSKEVGTGTAP